MAVSEDPQHSYLLACANGKYELKKLKNNYQKLKFNASELVSVESKHTIERNNQSIILTYFETKYFWI